MEIIKNKIERRFRNGEISESTKNIYLRNLDRIQKLNLNKLSEIIDSFDSIHTRKIVLIILKVYKEDFESINIDYDINIKIPKTKAKKPQVLSEIEIEKIIKTKICRYKWYQQRNTLIVLVLINTGIRVSELINIKIGDIHENSILIKGKGDKYRYVYISKELNKKLHDLYKRNKGQFIFLNKHRERLTRKGIFNIIRNKAKKANIKKKVYPHLFRHMFAIRMLNKGVDIYSVSKVLGHSNLNTTSLYLNITKDSIDNIISNSLNL